MSDFVIRQGDTSSALVETLRDADGDPVDISGAAIHLTVTPIRGGAPIVDAAADNQQVGDGSDGTKGRISYDDWTAQQTETPGDYLASIKVTFAGGRIQTFPNEGYILLTITPGAPIAPGRYLTLEEFKGTINMQGFSYADRDIMVAIDAASRGLEDAYGARWVLGEAGEQRYYTRRSEREVTLGDVVGITSVDLDYGIAADYGFGSPIGPGTYATQLAPSSYRLLPIVSGLIADGGNGEPYRTLQLARGAQWRSLPAGVDAIRVTGTFGWESTPAGVKTATSIIAKRLLDRARSSPFGQFQVGEDGTVVRAGQIARDPDIAHAMRALRTPRSLVV